MKEIAVLITSLLGLLKTSNDGNERRNLRLAKRMYKRLRKEFKKGGYTSEELEMLEDLKNNIVKRTIELG